MSVDAFKAISYEDMIIHRLFLFGSIAPLNILSFLDTLSEP